MATVLLVDDDAANREPVSRLLRMNGYEITRAANGRDGLELLEATAIDLVLLDLVMPDMDGITFLKALRNNPRLKDLPVVVLTALADGEAVHRSYRLGVNDYLVKSRFSAEQLLEVVRRQLAGDDVSPAAVLPEL